MPPRRKYVKVVERVLEYGSLQIPYRLHLRRRQGLRISVTPKLEVNIYAPSNAPKRWINDAVHSKASWIVKTVDRVSRCEILEFPDCYPTGIELPFLGRKYKLAIAVGKAREPELLLGSLVVTVSDPANQRSIRRSVYRWYRDQAAQEFDRSMERVLPLATRHDIHRPEVRIRNMKSRWGSCSSDGRVTLNLKLVMTPPPCIDYVLIHELCHIVHHDHSRQFYSLLSQCMPDWERHKLALDRYRMV